MKYYYPRTQEEYNRLMEILVSKGYSWGSGNRRTNLNVFNYKGGEIIIYLIEKRIAWCHKKQVPLPSKEIEIKA